MSRWRCRTNLLHPSPDLTSEQNHFLLPTPFQLTQKILRIFFGGTDANNIGRVYWIDVDSQKPERIIAKSSGPCLELGEKGAFDEHGVVPTCLLWHRKQLLLFYSGFQRLDFGTYAVFTGLAVSTDLGETFHRFSNKPLLSPTRANPFFRAASFVLADKTQFRMWFIVGTKWLTLTGGKAIPCYQMEYLESATPFTWDAASLCCLSPDANRGEIGFSRPWVCREDDGYRFWYAVRKKVSAEQVEYTHIESIYTDDVKSLVRQEGSPDLLPSAAGWDSEMVCYPAVQIVGDESFLFYCGNGNGRTGFGFAAKPQRSEERNLVSR